MNTNMLRSGARFARAAAMRTGHIAGPPQARAIRSFAPVAARDYQHLPLGKIPEGTILEAVREKWGSNAMDLINETDVIEVDGPVAVCDGGGGALGHPLEYIKLNVSDEDAAPQVCKYCGLRYKRKQSD